MASDGKPVRLGFRQNQRERPLAATVLQCLSSSLVGGALPRVQRRYHHSPDDMVLDCGENLGVRLRPVLSVARNLSQREKHITVS